jgi:hypothetical protein
MPKVKALVRGGGMWPDAPTHAHYSSELTIAARRLAEAALDQLGKLGVRVTLDESARARFSAARRMPIEARRLIELHGDAIEALLRERASSK